MKCHVTQNSQKIYSIYNIKYLFAIYISICMSIISHIKREWKKEKETWRMWTTAQGRSTAWYVVRGVRSSAVSEIPLLASPWFLVCFLANSVVFQYGHSGQSLQKLRGSSWERVTEDRTCGEKANLTTRFSTDMMTDMALPMPTKHYRIFADTPWTFQKGQCLLLTQLKTGKLLSIWLKKHYH